MKPWGWIGVWGLVLFGLTVGIFWLFVKKWKWQEDEAAAYAACFFGGCLTLILSALVHANL